MTTHRSFKFNKSINKRKRQWSRFSPRKTPSFFAQFYQSSISIRMEPTVVELANETMAPWAKFRKLQYFFSFLLNNKSKKNKKKISVDYKICFDYSMKRNGFYYLFIIELWWYVLHKAFLHIVYFVCPFLFVMTCHGEFSKVEN